MSVQRSLTAKLAAAALGLAVLGGCATLVEEDRAMLEGARSDAQRAEAAADRAESAAAAAETSAARAEEAYNRILQKP